MINATNCGVLQFVRGTFLYHHCISMTRIFLIYVYTYTFFYHNGVLSREGACAILLVDLCICVTNSVIINVVGELLSFIFYWCVDYVARSVPLLTRFIFSRFTLKPSPELPITENASNSGHCVSGESVRVCVHFFLLKSPF